MKKTYFNKFFPFLTIITFLLLLTTHTEAALQNFVLTNPPTTRNVLGNYAVAGNTVMCLTQRTSGYGGTCHGDTDYLTITSNMHVSKWLDIDSDTSTWNSTSSYINLPATYDPKDGDGKGILWAGLFWQGRISNDTNYRMHYGVDNGLGNPFGIVEAGRFRPFNPGRNTQAAGADHIRLKINNGTYNIIDSDTFYTYSSSGGQTYAAYADVTQEVQDANLTRVGNPTGKQVFTVANLVANEGREPSPGVFGGWSLVIIYAEGGGGKYRNISIYNGFDIIRNPSAAVKIEGFKLPKTGAVNAKIGVFSGEGEYRYGRNDANTNGYYDWMKISRTSNGTYSYITNTRKDNIFDGKIVGVQRDAIPGKFNDLAINNDGIDIDAYDVSSLMTGYRNIEQNISKIYIRTASNNDYVTPSMISFSAELYMPTVCYDFTTKLGDYIKIPIKNHDINSSTFNNLPLNIKFLIRSQEGDFNFQDARAHITFTNQSALLPHLDNNDTAMSPPDINSYFSLAEMPYLESNHTIGEIKLGSGVVGFPAATGGGILLPNATTYAQISHSTTALNADDINTHFTIHFDASIEYVPGFPVPYHYNTDRTPGQAGFIPVCPRNAVYDPIWRQFNIERAGASGANRYTLETQITGRPYNISIVSYAGDENQTALSTKTRYTGKLELELIDASGFDNDSQAGYDTVCEEPQGIGNGNFVTFNNADHSDVTMSSAAFPGYQEDVALKSAAFRLWVLTKKDANGTRVIMDNTCNNKTDGNCFNTLYTNQIVNDPDQVLHPCDSQCPGSADSCYQCLKRYYGFPICSRDNFAIRPDSYYIKLGDDGDANNTAAAVVPIEENKAGSNSATLAAGYGYALDIKATVKGADTASKGYYADSFEAQPYTFGNIPNKFQKGTTLSVIEFDNSASNNDCIDKNSSSINLRFINSQLDKKTYMKNVNAGPYKLWLADTNWTAVDQAGPLKPTLGTGANAVDDCISGSNNAPNTKAGCSTYSVVGSKTELSMNFEPYKFGLDEINVTNQPDNNRSYTYFNDFSNGYYADPTTAPIAMNAGYNGYLAALGKDNTLLTNFTVGCAAQNKNVLLNADIDTNPVNISNTPVQLYLQHTSILNTVSDSYEGTTIDANLTLPPAAFPKDINTSGKALILLHTTFKKPQNNPINPLIASYKGLKAFSPDASSNANKVSTYMPDGNQTYDRNITYFFAKITPLQDLYNNVVESWKLTPIFVDVYCSLTDCNNTYPDFPTSPSKGKDEGSNWFSATMFNQNTDGTTDLTPTTIFGENANPAVNPNDDVQFDDANGSQNDINVSLAGPGRPTTIDIRIEPVPWLIYEPSDPNGFPHYRVKFIGNSQWSGVGNTGNVAEATSNKEDLNRMNW